jgi:hypothetical protein
VLCCNLQHKVDSQALPDHAIHDAWVVILSQTRAVNTCPV